MKPSERYVRRLVALRKQIADGDLAGVLTTLEAVGALDAVLLVIPLGPAYRAQMALAISASLGIRPGTVGETCDWDLGTELDQELVPSAQAVGLSTDPTVHTGRRVVTQTPKIDPED